MRLFLAMTIGLFVWSCSESETITPLYEPREIQLADQFSASLEIYERLGATPVEPLAIRRFAAAIPFLGDLLELPLDFGRVLLPDLSDRLDSDISSEPEWTDSGFLKRIDSIVLRELFLTITPEDPEDRVCLFLFIFCSEPSPGFIKEIKLKAFFKDLQSEAGGSRLHTHGPLKGIDRREGVEIAIANREANLDEEHSRLTFDILVQDLKPYLEAYDSFDVKVLVKGKTPRRTMVIDGQVYLQVNFKIGI